MDWQQQWINGILSEIPMGDYRRRVEAELHDHLDSQYRSLTEAGRTPEQAQTETLSTMGESETLRAEYRAAWRRSLKIRHPLKMWARGIAVMSGVHFLVACVLGVMWDMATSLPGDSHDKWVRLIRDTLGNLNNSYLRYWLPLVLALIAGAFYLGRKFRASSCSVPIISSGLCLHWACIAAFNGWWRGIVDHHRPFWEAVARHFYYKAWHYAWTFMLCILLGVWFGYVSVKIKRSPAA